MADKKEKPKVLIDACATPALAEQLRVAHGIDAVHVDSRLPPGASDVEVLALARAERRIVVTINAEDFRTLARSNRNHPGLVILPSVKRAAQIQLGEAAIRRILADIEGGQRPDGHVYDVDDVAKIRKYRLPK